MLLRAMESKDSICRRQFENTSATLVGGTSVVSKMKVGYFRIVRYTNYAKLICTVLGKRVAVLCGTLHYGSGRIC